MNKEKKVAFRFMAIDPSIEISEVKPVEKETRKGEMVNWGTKNNYPSWLYDIYSKTTTMKSIINCITNYVVGGGIEGVDTKLIRDMVETYCIFGGIPLHIVKNKAGETTKVECLDMRHVRTDKKKEHFYYNEGFGDNYQRTSNSILIPKYQKESKYGDSIMFYSNTKYSVYPVPEWSAAVKACIIEQKIDDFHYNDLINGFASDVVYNFNSGVPEDEEKKEIEKMIMEKYQGVENAGRPLINFSEDKEHALEVTPISVADFGDRYMSLLDNATHKQYAAWRTNANLIGITEGNNSFNSIEFEGLYMLFEAQVIKPIRKIVEGMLSEVYNKELEIKPFHIQFNDGVV